MTTRSRFNQRRQGGKEVRKSDLLMDRDAGMGGDVNMGMGGEEANRETSKGGLVGQMRLMISGACSTAPARWAGSGGPDLLYQKLEILEWGAGFQQLEIVEPLGLTVG